MSNSAGEIVSFFSASKGPRLLPALKDGVSDAENTDDHGEMRKKIIERAFQSRAVSIQYVWIR
jgi:hypothetical protein